MSFRNIESESEILPNYVLQDPKEKIEQYIAHRYQREAQILVALEKQAGRKTSAMEIVKVVYTVSIHDRISLVL